MARTASIRRWHRRLGLFVGLQLLLWTLSGAFFAWTNIDEVRGDHRRAEPSHIPWSDTWVSPTALDLRDEALVDLRLVAVEGRTFYRAETADGGVVLADAETGARRSPIDADEARRIAIASFAEPTEVESVRRLEDGDVGPHHEYRGGPLPAWVVDFDRSQGTRVYVAASDGAVVRHRNSTWRVFDLLWMLHTMDYRGRDDINNTLLRAASVLAVILTLSGFTLWWLTRPRRRPRAH